MNDEISVSEILQHSLHGALEKLKEKGFDTKNIDSLGINLIANGKRYNVQAENLRNSQIDMVYRCF